MIYDVTFDVLIQTVFKRNAFEPEYRFVPILSWRLPFFQKHMFI